MALQNTAVEPIIDIGGKEFNDSTGARVSELVVDTDLTAADSCTITVLDTDRQALAGLGHGDAVSVKVPAVDGRGPTTKLFTGEIYSLEFESDERGTYSRIQAFDKSYRLKQHRVTKAYLDVKDSDVARTIAQAVGLTVGTIDQTKVKHVHLGQVNETHWDFLRERAAANDYELFIRDDALNFCKPDPASGAPQPAGHESTDPLQLTSGKNLRHLKTRTTAAQQVESVEVRGWNPTEKKAVTAKVPVNSTSTALKTTSKKLASSNGSASRVTPRADFSTQAECESMAASLAQRSASSFAYAEGTALGTPGMRAGEAVAIGESGPFDGKYVLTRVRHVFRPGDYATHFTVSGNHDRSRFGVVHTAPSNLWPGVYPAIVTDLKDPERLGRVRLNLPWLDDRYVTGWARVMQIGAGHEEGLLWFPEVNDEVIVSFMSGDIRHPVVCGGLFNGKDKAPFADYLDADKGTVDVRGMQSRSGHRLVFFDKKGEERIEIATSAGTYSLRLDDAEKELVIEATDGDVRVKASQANVTIESGDLTVKGANVKIEASASVEIKASSNMKLQAGGTMEIKGAMVKLN